MQVHADQPGAKLVAQGRNDPIEIRLDLRIDVPHVPNSMVGVSRFDLVNGLARLSDSGRVVTLQRQRASSPHDGAV
jgi:hypothetical protein